MFRLYLYSAGERTGNGLSWVRYMITFKMFRNDIMLIMMFIICFLFVCLILMDGLDQFVMEKQATCVAG